MKTNNLYWYHISQPFCQENAFSPLTLILAVQHGSYLQVSSLARFSMGWFTLRREHDDSWWYLLSIPVEAMLSPLLACPVPISSLSSKLLVVGYLPMVTATRLLNFRISLTLLYISVCTRNIPYLAHDFVCPGPDTWWGFCFPLPCSVSPASLRFPRCCAANDLLREF